MKSALGIIFLACVPFTVAGDGVYPWLSTAVEETLESRIPTPPNYQRVNQEPKGYGQWLRGLPLLPGRPAVKLYNGAVKWNQRAHFAVMDIDVGKKDLQQCADAVMRLRAEYLYSKGGQIAFNFTNGQAAAW